MLRQAARAGELTGDRGEQLAVERRSVAADERLELLAAEPELLGARSPRRHERRRIDVVLLAPPGVERGGLRCPRSGRPALLERGLDLRPAPREGAQDVRRHAIDVRDPVAHRRPRDAELARQLRSQPRLVEIAGGLAVRVEPTPVERRPAPVVRLDEVGDEDVRVQLRVTGARGPVPERRRDEPAPSHADRAGRAATRNRSLPLEIGERVAHGRLMGAANRRPQSLVPDPEEHADALGRGEGDVEARDARCGMTTERLAGRRVGSFEHPPERGAVDAIGELQRCCTRAHPDAVRVSAVRVVVLDA